LNLLQFKALLIIVTAAIALIVVSPALQQIQVFPQTEFFTELSLLGPGKMAANYPYNIAINRNYGVFLDISNHLGSCAYYQVKIKFRNETQSDPNSFNRTYSTLPSLYNVAAFVADKESWQLPITFSFNYSFTGVSSIAFSSIKFNGVNLNLAGLTSNLNSTINVFSGNLVFELWIYNGTTNTFQYHERFVSLLMNMTG
jgi:hypothetical protein